jgi:hypothetical protein
MTRAQLAATIVLERLKQTGLHYDEIRVDRIGIDALYGSGRPGGTGEPREVRLRVAGRTRSMDEALRIGNEVETLYTNGPAGGGGVAKSAREVIAVLSVLISRSLVKPAIHREVI